LLLDHENENSCNNEVVIVEPWSFITLFALSQSVMVLL